MCVCVFVCVCVQPYQCPKYKAVGQGLEEEVARRLAEVEQREAERTRYVQQLKEQTEAAQQAVQVMLQSLGMLACCR